MVILTARTLSPFQKLKHSLYSLSQRFTFAQHQQSLPTPKSHHLHFSSASNISLPQHLLYPLSAMEITRNPLPLSALVVGFTCKTQTLTTLAFSSSPRRRIPIITHIPISFTLLRNQNFRVPSKWVS